MDGALADAAAALLGGGRDPAPLLRGGDDLLGGLHRDADRFFAQHVDPRVEQPAAVHVVQAVRAADVGPVQADAAVEQLVDTAKGAHLPAHIPLDALGKGPGTRFDLVHGGDNAEPFLPFARQFLEAVEMGSGHAAAADDGQIDHLAFFLRSHSLFPFSGVDFRTSLCAGNIEKRPVHLNKARILLSEVDGEIARQRGTTRVGAPVRAVLVCRLVLRRLAQGAEDSLAVFAGVL